MLCLVRSVMPALNPRKQLNLNLNEKKSNFRNYSKKAGGKREKPSSNLVKNKE